MAERLGNVVGALMLSGLAGLAGLTGPAGADAPAPLPDFQTCMDIEVARYEQALTWLRTDSDPGRAFDIAGVAGVDVCGTVGILHCDRSDDRIACQDALTVRQDVLRDAVLRDLPAPDAVPEAEPAGQAGFARRLYALAWALAHGHSAGPDCAGAEPLFEAWCAARQANSRLRDAILLWQVARYLDRAAPAITVGWADPPPPVRPQARPGDQP